MERLVSSLGAALLALGAIVPIAAGAAFTDWQPAINVESLPGTHPDFNTAASDGCPAETRDGLRLFMASTRAGGFGGIDIWVASRDSTDAPWGAPVNAGPAINTGANEFCPSPARDGKGFMFVSNRAGGCGGDDIYVTRFHHRDGWSAPVNPGCSVNSAGNEASPFGLEDEAGGTWLYFSSTRAGGVSQEAPGVLTGDADLYVAAIDEDGSMGTPALVPGASSAANDARPNARRDGLELFFDSDRAGGFGGFDIWSAVRISPGDAWSTPSNLGSNVNSAVNETRPWLSWDRTALYFGAVRGEGGSQDIFVTTRSKD